MPKDTVLCSVKGVTKSFPSSSAQELLVLDKIDLTLKSGEIIALLGKSGAGKSTLLRIIAGLLKPSSGEVSYRGKVVTEPLKEAAMVFQSFALMPWLTVLQNVELGLEAAGVSRKERRQRALQTIDTIGLDGYESAYPKELSGGMRQRVGFARALVVEPELLLMDEPFSALDVLTAENLRSDLINLWMSETSRTKSILFVTHNIEEAALIADRIILFASDPGHIRAELNVGMPLPRDPNHPQFRKLIDDIYTLLTTTKTVQEVRMKTDGIAFEEMDIGYRLPDAETAELTGLVDALSLAQEEGNRAVDLPLLAEKLHMDADKLFPLTEALELIGLAIVSKGDISLTVAGKTFAGADILTRKSMFAEHLIARIPLAKHIRDHLEQAHKNRENENFFLEELHAYLTEDESTRVLTVLIDWGRYAEILAYDYESGDLSLENPN